MLTAQERRDLVIDLERILVGVQMTQRPYSRAAFEAFQETGRTTLFESRDERALKEAIEHLTLTLTLVEKC